MKLDNENDRNIILDLISKATVQGSTVLILADLVQRISAAGIEEIAASLPVAQQGKVETVLLKSAT